MDDFAAPVKGILKALDTGIKLAKRVSKSASSATVAHASQISDAAQALQRTLEESSKTVNDAYRHTVDQCGEPFTKALVEDSQYIALREYVYMLIHYRISAAKIKRTSPT